MEITTPLFLVLVYNGEIGKIHCVRKSIFLILGHQDFGRYEIILNVRYSRFHPLRSKKMPVDSSYDFKWSIEHEKHAFCGVIFPYNKLIFKLLVKPCNRKVIKHQTHKRLNKRRLPIPQFYGSHFS